MTPYINFLYFGISLYALIPAVIFGFFKRLWRAWLVIATLFMLVIQYSDINNEQKRIVIETLARLLVQTTREKHREQTND